MYIKKTNYYQKNKEKIKKEAREGYQNLSEEEKDKRRKKSGYRHQNLSEEEEIEKRVSRIVKVIRIFLRNKTKSKLSI